MLSLRPCPVIGVLSWLRLAVMYLRIWIIRSWSSLPVNKPHKPHTGFMPHLNMRHKLYTVRISQLINYRWGNGNPLYEFYFKDSKLYSENANPKSIYKEIKKKQQQMFEATAIQMTSHYKILHKYCRYKCYYFEMLHLKHDDKLHMWEHCTYKWTSWLSLPQKCFWVDKQNTELLVFGKQRIWHD